MKTTSNINLLQYIDTISQEDWHLFFRNKFHEMGINAEFSSILNSIVLFLILVLIAYSFNRLVRYFFVKFISNIAKRTQGKFDDLLISNHAFYNIAHLLTAFMISALLPFVMEPFPHVQAVLEKILDASVVILIIIIIRSFISAFKDYLKNLKSFSDKPLDSYLQITMIVFWILGLILVFSIFTGKSVWQFLTAMGALSAILLVLFKDTILGFVSTIQVSANDTVRIGDWITMKKHGADGTVIEINLSSVKVRNFDNTISTVPTYYLTSEAFQNWRGMEKSPGRRIMRSLNIKMNSVKFLTDDDLERLSAIDLIKDYILNTQSNLEKHNEERIANKKLLINGKNQTNLGLFRHYINLYLEAQPEINKDMLYLCRQLEPTPYGIPIQVFAFSILKEFKYYEEVQADLFDHIIASARYFGLEIFELPSAPNFMNTDLPIDLQAI